MFSLASLYRSRACNPQPANYIGRKRFLYNTQWCRQKAAGKRLLKERIAMSASMRPRRSVLFLPGSNPRALEKARALPADGLIFDLEDAVAPEAEAARGGVAAALT